MVTVAKSQKLYKMDEVPSVCQIKNITESCSDNSSDSVILIVSIVMSNLKKVMYFPTLISCSEGIQILNIIKL